MDVVSHCANASVELSERLVVWRERREEMLWPKGGRRSKRWRRTSLVQLSAGEKETDVGHAAALLESSLVPARSKSIAARKALLLSRWHFIAVWAAQVDLRS